ncbi:MAG TPA: SDR family oxidoreductase [Burkholderiales bacterium]|nr:SDR family oxidoreductase [Burkholderiales bacterium]
MELEISGKRALVTGASSGIGLSIAGKLHAEGCRVALNGRDQDALAMAAASLPGSFAVAGDVTGEDDARGIVAGTLAELGGIDILVCNVGSGASVRPGEESLEEWKRVFSVNLWSATNMVEAARQALADSKGSIVCISSICGIETIAGAPVTYSAAKAALNAYVRGISRPLGRLGVRINAVAPGNILFEGSVWQRKLSEDPDAVHLMLEREVALGSLGAPSEVADLVAYLASPRAGFATGSVWTLDGGQVHS